MIASCRLLFCVFSLLALIVTAFPSSGYAEVKEIIAEGTYSMGDGETPLVAEERCLLVAKRVAIEQAGTYVQSYSEIKNYQLTADEVQVIASGITEVTVLDKHRTMDGTSINFWVKIKAAVTSDNIGEMAANVKNRSIAEDYKRLQRDYDKSQQEVVALQQQLQQTNNDTDKRQIRSQITDSEMDFTANTWLDRGDISMINHQYNEAIKEFTEAIRLNSRLGRAYLGRGKAYTEVGEYREARDDYDAAHAINAQLIADNGNARKRVERRHTIGNAFNNFIQFALSNQSRMTGESRYQHH